MPKTSKKKHRPAPPANPAAGGSAAGPSSSNYRWTICALLFAATTINYIDRNIIGILKEDVLIKQLGWTEVDYGDVVFYFQIAYAFMMIAAGGIIDRIGTKLGFALAIIWWSFAAMGHAISGTVVAFMFWRFMLGIGEAANFPAAIKTVAEWFPKRERALATSIFNSGSNIGAIITPFAVAGILAVWGWQMVFIALGAVGFLWLIFWWLMYQRPEDHPRVSKAELDYIHSEPIEPTEKLPWLPLLRYKETWAFFLAKGLTDPVWWFYLFWIPGFLSRRFEVTIGKVGWPLMVIYIMASVGSIAGGWLAAVLLKRGWSVNAARKTTLLTFALAVTPVFIAATTSSLTLAVLLFGLACGAHQGWSANIFTTPSDMFPKRWIASVTGLGGCAGAGGGMIMAKLVSRHLNQNPNDYLPILIPCGLIYLVALLIFHFMVPKMDQVAIKS